MAPLMAGLYGKVYLFTADGALALKDGNWKEYAPSQTTVVGRFAAPCGHAHVLFFGDDSQKILAFHTVTSQWVEDWQLPQKLKIAAVAYNRESFAILGYENSIAGDDI